MELHNTLRQLPPHLQSIVAVGVISIIPTLILFLMPVLTGRSGKVNKKVLRVLLAFASGGLLGDVFLHLMPHSLDHSDPETAAIGVLFGICFFLLIEYAARLSTSSHSHSHTEKQQKGLSVGVFLNIFSDFSHNFTDGIAISASFSDSYALGVSTTFAILMHEFPHEIGDYAILISGGMEHSRAIYVQFLTAVGAFLGVGFGYALDHEIIPFVDHHSIIPFSAGGFIYVALVSILHELFQDSISLLQSATELMAFAAGIKLLTLLD